MMAVCNFFSTYSYSCPSPNFKKSFALTNPKRGRAGAACTSNQKWNISKDLEEYNLKENFWVEYKKKMEELRQHLNLDQYIMCKKENLVLVDAIQRVGMDHHFNEEIERILGQIYHSTNDSAALLSESDLYHLSLYFRLLRNQGYHVTADMFSVIKGNDGRFKEKLRHDLRGLMELHEAAQLRFRDEGIIDEVEEFSRMNLNKFLRNIKDDDDDWHNNKKLIKKLLTRPHHRNIPKLTARNDMDAAGFLNGTKKLWENTLPELAKMDFLIGDLMHQHEFLQFSKWWENVGIAETLQLARNQPMKWYTWSMALLINNPSLQLERIELAKAIAFIYLLDDIFDLYGTNDELTLFTQAVNRWEYNAIDMLPEYMRKCYKALLDTTNSIAQTLEEEFGTNPINSLKDTWESLCRAFLAEARWFRSGKLPTTEEYLENGKVSSGVHVVIVHLFFLLGLGRGPHPIDLNHTSTLISSIANILRLSDDLGSAKDENQDGFNGSYIKCYMNDEPKLLEKEARQHVEDIISTQWKYLKEECFLRLNHPSHSDFRKASLNFARMVPLMYTYDEIRGFRSLKNISMLLNCSIIRLYEPTPSRLVCIRSHAKHVVIKE